MKSAIIEQICHLLVRIEEASNAQSGTLLPLEDLVLNDALALKNTITKIQEDLDILSKLAVDSIDTLYAWKRLDVQAQMWLNEVAG